MPCNKTFDALLRKSDWRLYVNIYEIHCTSCGLLISSTEIQKLVLILYHMFFKCVSFDKVNIHSTITLTGKTMERGTRQPEGCVPSSHLSVACLSYIIEQVHLAQEMLPMTSEHESDHVFWQDVIDLVAEYNLVFFISWLLSLWMFSVDISRIPGFCPVLLDGPGLIQFPFVYGEIKANLVDKAKYAIDLIPNTSDFQLVPLPHPGKPSRSSTSITLPHGYI